VADLKTQADAAERFRARAQAEADSWRQKGDAALAQLPAAEATLAALESASTL